VTRQYVTADGAPDGLSWGFPTMITRAQAGKFVIASCLSVHAKMLIGEGPDQVLCEACVLRVSLEMSSSSSELILCLLVGRTKPRVDGSVMSAYLEIVCVTFSYLSWLA
jgi:hypothetical protein